MDPVEAALHQGCVIAAGLAAPLSGQCQGARIEVLRQLQGLPAQAYDEANSLEKFNPLADWTEREVWAYIRLNGVPYNALHDRHYASIGCAPCTRAITVGEDVRAGRWWWEDADTKECGLHVKKSTPLKAHV